MKTNRFQSLLRRLSRPGLLLLSTLQPLRAEDALDHWSFRSAGQVQTVRYTGGLFFGLGPNGTLMTSSNGTVWTAANSGSTATLRSVVYGRTSLPGFPNRYVAVGSGGTILTSPDAINWISASGVTQVNAIAWSGNRFVATTSASRGEPHVFWSTDCLSWHDAYFPNAENLEGVYGVLNVVDGYFMAAAGPCCAYPIYRSSNGSTWQNVGFSDAVIGGIASGNDRAIMVGWEGWPRVSIDQGASWFPSSSNVIDPDAYPYPMVGSDIAFGNGMFLVVRSFLQNGFLTTMDGMTWARRDLFVGANIDSVTYGEGTFVVSCSGGTYPAGLYQSENVAVPFLALALQSDPKAVVLNISGEVGRRYSLKTSSDLSTWSDRYYTNNSPTMQFIEPISAGAAQLFFKVVSP